MDIDRLTDELVATKDVRIKYVIANGLILDSRPGANPWRWMPYRGPNPHTKHFHLSVVASPLCDDPRPWALPSLVAGPVVVPPAGEVLAVGSVGAAVTQLQQRLNRMFPSYSHLVVDGVFGPATEAVVREFQRRSGLTVDGIAGPATLSALHLGG